MDVPLAGKRNGVVDQIVNHLADFDLISLNPGVLLSFKFDRISLLFHQLLVARQRFPDLLSQIKPAFFHPAHTGLYLRKI